MKRRDWILILAVLLVTGALLAFRQFQAARQTVTAVVARIDGEEVLRVPLSQDGIYRLEQADGSLNVLQVAGGAARVLEANCRDGLCIRQGEMKNAAKTLVCLPHRLVISLEAETGEQDAAPPQDDLDVIVY